MVKSMDYGEVKKKIVNLYTIFGALGLVLVLFVFLTIFHMFYTQITVDFNAIIEAAKDPTVLGAIWNSIFASFIATIIAFIFGVPLAYVLARKKFVGKGIVESIIDLPIVVPHTVAGIALLTLLGNRGLIGAPLNQINIVVRDSILGTSLAMLFVSLPFLINQAREGFEKVDPRLENVARNLGSSRAKTFFKITFPLSFRSLLAGSIMSWGRGISEFGAVVMIAYYPMTAPTLIFTRYNSYGLDNSRPVSIVLITISMAIFLVLRIISKGIKNYAKD